MEEKTPIEKKETKELFYPDETKELHHPDVPARNTGFTDLTEEEIDELEDEYGFDLYYNPYASLEHG